MIEFLSNVGWAVAIHPWGYMFILYHKINLFSHLLESGGKKIEVGFLWLIEVEGA